MKSVLYNIVLGFFRKFGYEIVKETPKDELVSLLRSQAPLDSGIRLIRIGNQNDGGYLVPDDLIGISKCISPGCNQDVSFETDLLNRFGIASVIIDKADAKPPILDHSHEYIEKWLSSNDTDELISLSSLLRKESKGDLMLQMDIEGAEYEVLLGIPKEDLARFRIILIEFHFLSNLRNQFFFEYVGKSVFEKLSQTHTLVHAHPNNCTPSWSHQGILYPEVIEFSYIRKDRVRTGTTRADVPNILDAPNIVGNAEPVIKLK